MKHFIQPTNPENGDSFVRIGRDELYRYVYCSGWGWLPSESAPFGPLSPTGAFRSATWPAYGPSRKDLAVAAIDDIVRRLGLVLDHTYDGAELRAAYKNEPAGLVGVLL